MLRRSLFAGLILLAAPAFADGDSATITLTGSVDKACHMGSPSSSTISLGALAAQSDGTLASITVSPVTISGSWCNAGSTIGIIGTPIIAQSYTGAPPSGFTKAVNYSLTASGWTTTAAVFVTTGDSSGGGSGTTPTTQPAISPVAQNITVGLSNFATPAAGLRLVADPNYSGTITVTLSVTP